MKWDIETAYSVNSLRRDAYPMLQVIIRDSYDPDNYRILPALVDSGSPLSCIPYKTADEMNLVVEGESETSGLDGQGTKFKVHYLSIRFADGKLEFPAVKVLRVPLTDFAVIGRNVLNKIAVQLDGPQGMLRIRE